MRSKLVGAVAALGFLVATVPVVAHHATQAEYDKDNQKEITGVMKRDQWINPHVRWYLDVKNDDGTVTTWMIGGSGPGAYRSNGITARGVFPIGETFTARIALARDGTPHGYIMTWTLPDGTKMDFWHDYGEN
jgi:hypothetical protein